MTRPCPRCQAVNWQLYGQTFVLIAITPEGRDTKADPLGDDFFMHLACESCGLILASEPGDGRVRRASLYDNDDDRMNDRPLQDNPLEEAVKEIATALLDEGYDT